MGITIYLQNEAGEPIETIIDDRNLLHRQLDSNTEDILSGIDWYGDTVFNRLQMRQFIPAFEALTDCATDPDERRLLTEILALAKRIREEVHLYLKFEGD